MPTQADDNRQQDGVYREYDARRRMIADFLQKDDKGQQNGIAEHGKVQAGKQPNRNERV